MKRLLVLLFTFAVAFSLAMPVFAQDTSQGTAPTTTKTKKAKKAKKTKAAKTAAAPTQ